MPSYTVKCQTCSKEQIVFRHLSDYGKWPRCCRRKTVQVIGKLHIMKDIEPYKAVAYDVASGKRPVIRSRAHHKEFLRDNGYEEVGNEKPKPQGLVADKLDSPRAEIVKNLKIATGRPA